MDWSMPEVITTEFLSELSWKPGPLELFEICELGLVRRPLELPVRRGAMQPGCLYTPEPRGASTTRYRLHRPGERAPTYLIPRDVMVQVFGRYLNTLLEDVEYVKEMRATALEYNFQNFRQDKRLAYQHAEEDGMIPMRRCATCGKKTRSYRCEACWAKIRSKETSCDEPTKEYRIGRG